MAEKSIFEFADKFGYESPFGDWVKDDFKAIESVKFNIQNIDGPFDNDNIAINYVSRFHSYKFVATLDKEIKKDALYQINWAVSFDDEKEIFYLFSGGKLKGNKLNANIQISKGKDKFKIYAYVGKSTTPTTNVEVYYKKTVAFFIGGAGDKKSYAGSGPTEIIKDEVSLPFALIAPINDYTGVYLGYYEVYKQSRIDANVIAYLKDKIGYQVYIIGHSLGGWNGAHLYEKLKAQGYNTRVLITLDPVGTKRGVTAVSDIYYDYPNPISSYWLNTKTEPEENEVDDYIAFSGGQWEPSGTMLVDYRSKLHHREAGKMFNELVKNNLSMSNFLLIQINTFLNEK
jgi:hypothetical protein